MKQDRNYENYRFVVTEYHCPNYVDWSKGYPWHAILHIEAGYGVFKAENVTLNLKAGDLYYIPLGISYKCSWKSSHTRLRSTCFRYFPEAESTPFAPQILPKRFIALHKEIRLHIQPNIETLANFYSFLKQLLPEMKYQEQDNAHRLVYLAKKMISGTGMYWSNAELAAECGVCEATLYSAFKKVENKTPNEVRHEIVIDTAVHLLLNSNSSISRISQSLGFSSDTYFRKFFKKHTGKTPRDVRKEGLHDS